MKEAGEEEIDFNVRETRKTTEWKIGDAIERLLPTPKPAVRREPLHPNRVYVEGALEVAHLGTGGFLVKAFARDYQARRKPASTIDIKRNTKTPIVGDRIRF
ncbi:uncharacterized protein N7496_010713 [Penicillium cataractarum]|uniref:Uncharacterized protein n=1 Tax=Penicillium cataractarum TaxID=2100454 RepID=A0A9W9UWZ0_9EURO|nr:uncharacterized protein N7496_010713 [Penicillium cataractarum]KAJ5358300.1 hypothetical protein N7496_010713 [Penicillium cataractarum]